VSHDGGLPARRLLLFEPRSDHSALVFSRQQKSMVSPELHKDSRVMATGSS